MNRVIKRDIEQGGGERGEEDTGGKRIMDEEYTEGGDTGGRRRQKNGL